MRNTVVLFVIFLAVLFGFTACGANYSRDTPQELGTSIFEAIKNQDREGIMQLLPTKDDLLATIAESDIADDEKAEAREEISAMWGEIYEKMKEGVNEEFDELLEEEDAKVPNLEEAVLDLIEVGKPREREGLRQTDIKVHFKVGEQKYRIDVRKAAQLKSGWVMSPDGFRIREER